jgi:hypothetical protein
MQMSPRVNKRLKRAIIIMIGVMNQRKPIPAANHWFIPVKPSPGTQPNIKLNTVIMNTIGKA